MDYSIIIPAYNETEQLPPTLSAVRTSMAASALQGECIVVDNNSTDSTAETARLHGADLVVFEPFNQIARARNAGARASKGRYLVFIDADTRIDPTVLQQALNLLSSGQCVGGGAVVHFEGEVSIIGQFGIKLWEFLSKSTQTAAGSFMFCLQEAYQAVGGFDERLFASEEIRLSKQLKRWGRRNNIICFKILIDTPVLTSARKLQWYSGPKMLGWVIFMLFVPISVRSRKLCGFWYKRPNDASASR